ncbi:hypothetical protein MVEN_01973200 [Mycena venus]|uniref:CCHC-type domain-containing protein n=1 Tax=Mycena venus TaxID=2733690 RepID=A0A8H6XCT2_9AGAR|nr:hypothetical protein MVEN_01973200 [Mycena venus]
MAENRSGMTEACYKCSEEGHFSANCPTTGGAGAKSKLGGSGSALTCFKCGEGVHFFNGASNLPSLEVCALMSACTSDGLGSGSAPRRSLSSRRTAKRGRGNGSSSGGSERASYPSRSLTPSS